MKKNWIMWALGLGALYLFTKKSSTTTTSTDTEDKGTPDLGNGSNTPTPTSTTTSTSTVPYIPGAKVDNVSDTRTPEGTQTPYVGTPPQTTEDRNRGKGTVYTM